MICNICECSVKLKINPKTNEQYVFCENCLFVQKVQILDENDELDRYLEHNNKCDDEVYQQYFINMLNPILENLPKDSTILDYGSGPEPVLQHTLKMQGYNNVKIYDLYFANDLAVFSDKYDVITCVEVIEHIKDIKALMKLFVDLINENGFITIKTERYESQDTFFDWWYIRDPTHISLFHDKTFLKLADLYNLEIQFIDKLVIFRRRK